MGFYAWKAVLVCALATVALTSAQEENEAVVVGGNNAFGNTLFKMEGHGNAMISPYSAETVLSMLMMGAEGTTLSTMARALGLPVNKDVVARGFQSLLQSNRKIGSQNLTLSTANRIYVAIDFDIKEAYLKTLNTYFFSDIVGVDFTYHSDESRMLINQWVAEQTNGKIQDLLPENSVVKDTRTVLVNAIYFKGKWKYTFDKENTKPQEFHKSCDDSTQVDMMNLMGDLNYDEYDDYQVVQLNYHGDEIYMLIILPRDCNGVERFSQKEETLNVTEIQRGMGTSTVRLSLPKFTIAQTINMNDDLKNLGLAEIFTNTSNFHGITEEKFVVNDVIQKTFIEVSEEGTEAAVVTGSSDWGNAPAPPTDDTIYDFIADHPFIFAIMNAKSKAVLFLGSYTGN